jgi:hypothetical protein
MGGCDMKLRLRRRVGMLVCDVIGHDPRIVVRLVSGHAWLSEPVCHRCLQTVGRVTGAPRPQAAAPAPSMSVKRSA